MKPPLLRLLGDDLIEIDVPDAATAQGLAEGLMALGRFEEVVPALNVVAVMTDPTRLSPGEAEEAIRAVAVSVAPRPSASGEERVIPVHYGGEDGPDIEGVAQAAGLKVEDFIALHTSRAYPVDMIGFTPGFAYLGGLDERIEAGRLASPRAFVPEGSVGVIKGYSGIYPLAGPGGWPIVGRTDATLFEAGREDPFLLRPGMTVRFEAV